MLRWLLLKARHSLTVLITVILALGVGFLALTINSVTTQAAPLAQGGVLQLIFPAEKASGRASVYTITNQGTLTATTAHRFFSGTAATGQLVTEFRQNQAPFETKSYTIDERVTIFSGRQTVNILNVPQEFVGEVVITSNQPITGSVVVVSPAQPTAPSRPAPNRREVNWSIISYFVIGLFALSGFFRGWWKEAVLTFLLAILVLFLRVPSLAQWVIDRINDVLRVLWAWLPTSLQEFAEPFLGVSAGTAPQINAGHSSTWMVILIIFIGLSILIARPILPNYVRGAGTYFTYVVTPMGSFLGGLLGGLNGFLIINLVREYLTGSNLPAGPGPVTEIAVTGGETLRIASSGVAVTITNLPNLINLNNNIVAWAVTGFGLLILLLVLANRTTFKRFRITAYKTPSGYRRYVVK